MSELWKEKSIFFVDFLEGGCFATVRLFLNIVPLCGLNSKAFGMEGVKRKLNVLSIEEKMKTLTYLDKNPLMKKKQHCSQMVKFVVDSKYRVKIRCCHWKIRS